MKPYSRSYDYAKTGKGSLKHAIPQVQRFDMQPIFPVSLTHSAAIPNIL